jgi:hypothetical protein
MNEFADGLVTGTGAAINIYTGWLPARVTVTNNATGASFSWNYGLASGYAVKSGALITTGGVTPLSDATGNGFTIGTDAVNTNGNQMHYFAERAGAGSRTR